MMNLKYYLRGLGVGVIVTAIIMGIAAGGKKEPLSTEEIKERARALGMTENTVLADTEANQQEPEAAPTKTPDAARQPVAEATQTPMPAAASTPEAAPSATPSAAPTPARTSEPTPIPTPSASVEPTASPTEKPAAADGGAQNSEAVSITVSSGDGSLTVSRKLEQAGLVVSAADFDLYLCQNGYDKRLNVGTFEIPANADPEQIARILAKLE